MKIKLISLLFTISSVVFCQAPKQDIMRKLAELSDRSVTLQNDIYEHQAPYMKDLDCKMILMYEMIAQQNNTLPGLMEMVEYHVMLERELKGKKNSWLLNRSRANFEKLPDTLSNIKIKPDVNKPYFNDQVQLQSLVIDFRACVEYIKNNNSIVFNY